MRARIALSVLAVMLVMAACSEEKHQTSSLVMSESAAPYYTNLADALEAAKADQYVVVDFYTDW